MVAGVSIRGKLAARGDQRIQGSSSSAASDPPAEMIAKLVLFVTVVSANVARSPVEAWYKQVVGPSYYPVGRASGLLSGVRRWPYVRRAELEPTDGGESAGSNNALAEETPQKIFPLKTMVSPLPELEYQKDAQCHYARGANAHLTDLKSAANLL